MSKLRIALFAAAYLALVVGCVVSGLEIPFAQLHDGGGPQPDGTNLATSLLLAPADQLWAFLGRSRFGPIAQWVMIAGNAILWGVLFEALYGAARDRLTEIRSNARKQ